MPDTHTDDTALRVRAIESLLIEKGLVQPAALAAIVEAYETKIGPHNGAQVVARAWTDPAHYLQSSYCEHWMHAMQDLPVQRGALARDEIDGRTAQLAKEAA